MINNILLGCGIHYTKFFTKSITYKFLKKAKDNI
jgi:hypothetical protein